MAGPREVRSSHGVHVSEEGRGTDSISSLGVARRASTRVDPAPEQRADPRLGDGLAFVESRSSDPLIGVGDVARAMGVGRRQAERIFAANGKSIRLCIEESRLVRARKLLAGSDKTAAAIAVECGFASETYFSRLFRRRHGMSPGTWRRNATQPRES